MLANPHCNTRSRSLGRYAIARCRLAGFRIAPRSRPGTDAADDLWCDPTRVVARWKPVQPGVGDRLGHNCRGIAVDLQENGPGIEDDRLFVYTGFSRAGIRILECLVEDDGSGGIQVDLELVGSLQTSAQVEQMEIQRYLDEQQVEQRRLFVTDERAGLRVYADRE